jgi:phosphatidylglycerophosphatase C
VSAVAAFDVDGTLTTRDCVVPFLRRLGGWPAIGRSLVAQLPATLRAGVARDRDRVKAVVVGGVFAGRGVAEVEREGEVFADIVRHGWLRSDTLARLRWHQQQRHHTVLVSASLGPYLRPLGRMLDVDGVLCTEGAVVHGTYQRGLDGNNCRGPEKAVRLARWLQERGLSGAELWAYGDSAGDDEMLAMATHPQRVDDRTIEGVPA